MYEQQDHTKRLNLLFLSQYQAQKELLVNENMRKLDLLYNRGVISYTQELPDEPVYGCLAIVPETAVENANALALFTGSWEYIEPMNGMLFFAEEERQVIIYVDQKWRTFTEALNLRPEPIEQLSDVESDNMSVVGRIF